jgi:dienelactone hydrolase
MNLQRQVPSFVFAFPALLLASALARADEANTNLAAQLRKLDGTVIAGEQARNLSRMVWQEGRTRLRAAALRENEAWQKVQTRADWEAFRDSRVRALRESLGPLPAPPIDRKVRVTRSLKGPGYRIENVVFESQPGLVVTANLYLPAPPPRSLVGVLIVPSHHNPKTQPELQDMGVTWARQGCAVLVPDVLGHGERRQHPFAGADSYPRPFKVGRQDYYFRYNTGVQLQLIGDSLMGWMVADLRRCLDVLLTVPGIDRERIVVIGSVASGGDSAAVTAALDPRVRVVAPFNFGGPQPDYSIPKDAEREFYWFGVPEWESTRCLRLGARDGFAQWVIVAAVAPRRVLYCHEFGWDADRDPAWPRLQKVFGFYGAANHLAEAHGKGQLRGKPPDNTHCNNVGPYHRSQLYPVLRRWLDFPVPRKESLDQRRPARDLACLTPELVKELRPRSVHDLAAELGLQRAAAARARRAGLRPAERRQHLCQDWARLLGNIEPKGDPRATILSRERLGDINVERVLLEPEPGILVPVVFLLPGKPSRRPAVVVAVAQQGKQGFLKQRAQTLARLVRGGVAVCLPDLRGTGETRPGGSRRYNSTATSLSAAELLLGQTMLGARLRDLRSVLCYVRGRPDLDGRRLALWGDSFAPPNPPGRRLEVPPDVAEQPDLAEPLGGLLALFGALYEDDVRAVYARGGLVSYRSVLASPFFYVPHDVLVPGALTAGDLADVAGALAPRPLRLEGLVDGLDRQFEGKGLEQEFVLARSAYRLAAAEDRLRLAASPGTAAAPWLLTHLAAR